MATLPSLKKISALPLYSTGTNSGTLLYTESGTDYQFPLNNIALLSSLGSSDGFKYIGTCPNLAILRTVEPQTDGDKIILRRAVDSGPIINAVLTYDANDTTTLEDGYSIFVTTNGARWKADVSDGIDLRLTGYIKNTTSISTCIDTVVDSIVTRIVDNGNLTTQQTVINIYSDYSSTTDSTHIVTSTIKLPKFITLKFHGNGHVFKATTDAPVFKIDDAQFLTSHGLTWTMLISGYADPTKLKSNASKKVVFDAPQGIWLMGLGSGYSTTAGIILGQTNTVAGSPGLACDISLEHVNVSKFSKGIQLGTTNTYNLYIDNCYFDGIDHGVYAPNGDTENAGETIHFSNTTISAGQSYGNTTGIGIYSDAFAFNLTFSKCHIDYCSKTVLSLGPHATYSHFRFNNGWIEGFTKLVDCASMYVGNVPRIFFDSIEFDMRTADGVTWGAPRQILDSGATYTISFDKCTFVYYKKPGANTSTVAFCGTDTKSMGRMNHGISYFGATTIYKTPRPYPIDIASSIRGLALFSGTAGTAAINSYDNSQLSLATTGSPTVVYGPTTDMLGSFQSLAITMSATTDVVYLYARHKLFLRRGDSVAGSCSIKLGTAVGNVNVSTCLRNYISPALTGTVSGTTATITRTAVLNSTVDGVVIEDVLTYLSVTGTTLTTEMFVGVEPTWVSQNYTAMTDTTLASGYEYSLPALKLTGFTGTIYLALPFWWVC